MWWLWFVGPVAAGLLFLITGQIDKRALREIDAWREALGARRSAGKTKDPGSKKKKKKVKDLRPKKLDRLPADVMPALDEVGGGRWLGDYELAAKVAYATFVMGDLAGSSDHQTVLVRLSEKAPSFIARPYAFFAGKPLPSTAIEFRKDPEFAAAYVVEANATHAKSVGKWLTRELRELLIDSGEVWLRVEGKTLAITIYGTVRQDKIESLIELADVFVAEYGEEDGPSLFGEDEEERAIRRAAPSAEAEAEDEDEDEDDADEGDEDDGGDEKDVEEKPAKKDAKVAETRLGPANTKIS